MILELQDLSFDHGHNRMFAGVSLALAAVGIVALTGANGSGKTTLLNLIAGDYRSTGGRVRFEGEDITGWGSGRRARAGLGYAYQHTEVVSGFGWNDHVDFAARGLGRADGRLSREATDGLVERLAKASGIADLDRVPAEVFSFGQKKLLNIACVVRRRPRLALFDEPFAGIAIGVMPAVEAVIAELGKSAAVIMVDHNPARVAALAHSEFRIVRPAIERIR